MEKFLDYLGHTLCRIEKSQDAMAQVQKRMNRRVGTVHFMVSALAFCSVYQLIRIAQLEKRVDILESEENAEQKDVS